MTNLDQINRAIEYIEEHLLDEIGLGEIAESVNFSEYHFHRMFKNITDYSLMDYIRRRRLSHAANDIVNTVEDIASIAYKYRFGSQSSFTVAFKRIHGVTPGELRLKKGNYKHFVELKKYIIKMQRPIGLIEEGQEVRVEPFSVMGFQCNLRPTQYSSANSPIKKLWEAIDNLEHANWDTTDQECLVAVYDFDPMRHKVYNMIYTYTLGYKCRENGSPTRDMKMIHLFHKTYLRFKLNLDLSSFKEAYRYIECRWFPKSKYILSDSFDFEIHSKSKNSNIVEIYISYEEL